MSKYRVVLDKKAEKQLSKMDRHVVEAIYAWLRRNLYDCTNPRQYGKALTGKMKGLWRYRVGAYRLVAEIQDQAITILILNVGQRKGVYRDN